MYREDGDALYCLSSGQPASDEVCGDLLRYIEVGEISAAKFIQTTLVEKTIPFHTAMKRQKLKTFTEMAVTKPAIGKQKTVQITAERNLLESKISVFGTMMCKRPDVPLSRGHTRDACSLHKIVKCSLRMQPAYECMSVCRLNTRVCRMHTLVCGLHITIVCRGRTIVCGLHTIACRPNTIVCSLRAIACRLHTNVAIVTATQHSTVHSQRTTTVCVL